MNENKVWAFLLKQKYVTQEQILQCQKIQQEYHKRNQAVNLFDIVKERHLTPEQMIVIQEFLQAKHFGRYRILGVLGKGGMGKVYRVYDPQINREVALKTILGQDDSLISRFMGEARAMGKLSHPNIIKIYDIGEVDGTHYFTMELIAGETLSGESKVGKLPVRRIAEIMETVALAMDYVHQQGIIHRDLKPSNIMMDHKGQPCIMDFGIARDIDNNTKISKSGAPLGTVSYMSPEQVSGRRKDISSQSDVYSLGVILYELLTGRVPFIASSMPALVTKIMRDDAVAPGKISKRVPSDLDTICLKALAKKQEYRYVTAKEFAEDLRRFLEGIPIQASVQIDMNFRKWFNSKAAAVLFLASTILLLLLVAYQEILYQVKTSDYRSKLQEYNSQLKESQLSIDKSLAKTNDVQDQLKKISEQKFHLGIHFEIQALLQQARWYLENQMRQTATIYYTKILSYEKDFPQFSEIFSFVRFQLSYHSPKLFVKESQKDQIDDFFVIGDYIVIKKDNSVSIRNIKTQKTLRSFTGKFQRLSMSEDGSVLCSLDNKSIVIQKASENKGVYKLDGPGGLEYLKLSPDGKTIAYSSGKKSLVEIIDVETRKLKKRLDLGFVDDRITPLSFSSDSRYLSYPKGEKIVIWDLQKNTEIRSFNHSKRIFWNFFGWNDKILVFSDASGKIYIWDWKSQYLVGSVYSYSQINSLAISPEHQILASCGDNKYIQIWDIHSSSLIRSIELPAIANKIAFSKDYLFCLTQHRQLYVWKLPEHIRTNVPASTLEINDVRFHPNKEYLFSCGRLPFIHLWQVPSGELINTKGVKCSLRKIAIHPNNQVIYGGSSQGELMSWDLSNLQELSREQLFNNNNKDVSDIKISSDGLIYIIASSLKIGEMNDNRYKLIKELSVGARFIELLDDNSFIIESRRSLKIMSLDNNRDDVLSKTDSLSSMAISPDLSTVVYGNENGHLVLQKWQTKNTIKIQSEHKGQVDSIKFSPDNSYFASGASDRKIYLWHTETGYLCDILYGHTDKILSIDISKNGKWMASSDFQGRVILWNVARDQDIFTLPFSEIEKKISQIIGKEMYDKLGQDLGYKADPEIQQK